MIVPLECLQEEFLRLLAPIKLSLHRKSQSSQKCTHFSSRAGWVRKILRFIKNIFRKQTRQFLSNQWVICLVFDWFVGSLVDLWVVSNFTANENFSSKMPCKTFTKQKYKYYSHLWWILFKQIKTFRKKKQNKHLYLLFQFLFTQQNLKLKNRYFSGFSHLQVK